jgi:hypothetical protein
MCQDTMTAKVKHGGPRVLWEGRSDDDVRGRVVRIPPDDTQSFPRLVVERLSYDALGMGFYGPADTYVQNALLRAMVLEKESF